MGFEHPRSDKKIDERLSSYILSPGDFTPWRFPNWNKTLATSELPPRKAAGTILEAEDSEEPPKMGISRTSALRLPETSLEIEVGISSVNFNEACIFFENSAPRCGSFRVFAIHLDRCATAGFLFLPFYAQEDAPTTSSRKDRSLEAENLCPMYKKSVQPGRETPHLEIGKAARTRSRWVSLVDPAVLAEARQRHFGAAWGRRGSRWAVRSSVPPTVGHPGTSPGRRWREGGSGVVGIRRLDLPPTAAPRRAGEKRLPLREHRPEIPVPVPFRVTALNRPERKPRLPPTPRTPAVLTRQSFARGSRCLPPSPRRGPSLPAATLLEAPLQLETGERGPRERRRAAASRFLGTRREDARSLSSAEEPARSLPTDVRVFDEGRRAIEAFLPSARVPRDSALCQ
ncbi:hypothetical protein KM043_004038 [Ampulex compressa]|nr:hypothetical protein KM043_004038 [Ampulex compressa]